MSNHGLAILAVVIVKEVSENYTLLAQRSICQSVQEILSGNKNPLGYR
jgi:hypothetical protein